MHSERTNDISSMHICNTDASWNREAQRLLEACRKGDVQVATEVLTALRCADCRCCGVVAFSDL